MKQHIDHLLQHESAQRALALLTGVLVGVLSWTAQHPPIPAVVLPFLVALAPKRGLAFLVALGYSMGVTRTSVDFSWNWFDGHVLYTALIWVGASLLGALGWMLAWTGSEKPWRKAAAQVLAWTVTLLPPLAILTNGHVLPAWGFLLQGWSWLAVIISVAVPAGFFLLAGRDRIPVWKLRVAVAMAFAVLVGASWNVKPVNTRFHGEIAAPSTHWGKASGYPEILERMYRIGTVNAKLADAEVTTVIWPESILQTYSPDMFTFIDDYILKHAEEKKMTVVLGADMTLQDGGLQSTAIAFYPDGRTATVAGRQPVPLVLWRPWKTKDSYKVDWTSDPVLNLGRGLKARMVFCYEEYIPLLALIDEATRDFNLTVAMSNTWAANSETASAIQAYHSQGMALMFGRKILRAENRAGKLGKAGAAKPAN